MNETTLKIQAAIEIFKARLPEAKGKYRPYIADDNGNEVDFYTEDGLYCRINIRNQKVMGI